MFMCVPGKRNAQNSEHKADKNEDTIQYPVGLITCLDAYHRVDPSAASEEVLEDEKTDHYPYWEQHPPLPMRLVSTHIHGKLFVPLLLMLRNGVLA